VKVDRRNQNGNLRVVYRVGGNEGPARFSTARTGAPEMMDKHAKESGDDTGDNRDAREAAGRFGVFAQANWIQYKNWRDAAHRQTGERSIRLCALTPGLGQCAFSPAEMEGLNSLINLNQPTKAKCDKLQVALLNQERRVAAVVARPYCFFF